MHTIIPAPKRVIHLQPILDQQNRRTRDAMLQTSKDLMALAAIIAFIASVSVICLMIK
ncbi:hypothetical protein [Pararhizobium qamdonense]|uniref:hypothetical protein n=1 Tax=Pararhizobium qamdonense TaxID=3031126 RepID=UPI0023E29801|nr:hypothetical protein [Pararhizobium qamdonense]